MQAPDSACDAIAVAGRFTIALLDTLTIFLLYLLGSRIFGRRGGGLFAATFYAFSAQAIQASATFAMDRPAPPSPCWPLGGVSCRAAQAVDRAAHRGCRRSGDRVQVRRCRCWLCPSWRRSSWSGALPRKAGRRAGRWTASLRRHRQPGPRLGCRRCRFLRDQSYAVLDWGTSRIAVLVEQGMMVRRRRFSLYAPISQHDALSLLHPATGAVGLGWALGLVAAAGTLCDLLRTGPVGLPLRCDMDRWAGRTARPLADSGADGEPRGVGWVPISASPVRSWPNSTAT